MTWDYDKAQLISRIQRLRDIDFLLGIADLHPGHQEQYRRIHQQAKDDAWEITQELFADAFQDEVGLLFINDTMLFLLSQHWWEQIDVAVAKL